MQTIGETVTGIGGMTFNLDSGSTGMYMPINMTYFREMWFAVIPYSLLKIALCRGPPTAGARARVQLAQWLIRLWLSTCS